MSYASENVRDCQGGRSRRRIKRRTFMGATLGGALIAGVTPAGARAEDDEEGLAQMYHETFDTPIVARHQVVVAGGGPSGVIAALAAARSGADTLLIERYGFLGGNGTAGLMISYNGFRNQRPPEALQTVKGIPADYIAEIVRLGGLSDAVPYPMPVEHDATKGDLPYCIGFDPEAAKIASLNLLKREGVTMRLHSWAVAPMLDGARVTGVIVESKSGRQTIAADIVVDATGDGDIAAGAGAPFMSPNKETDHMGFSLMYQLGGLPEESASSQGGIRLGDRVVKWGPGFDGDGLNIEDLTRAEIETRLALWDDIQKMRGNRRKRSLYLAQTATGVGVRETRRIRGEYTVTEQDAIAGVRFPDVIAISSNPMPDYHGKRFFFEHEGFDIPYRALVPQQVEGVVLTGRCISCEQGPFQSARSMAPAMAVGHASGCAAAMAAKTSVPPRRLDVKALQALLISQNAELRHANRA